MQGEVHKEEEVQGIVHKEEEEVNQKKEEMEEEGEPPPQRDRITDRSPELSVLHYYILLDFHEDLDLIALR
jgi:hypothetical protein